MKSNLSVDLVKVTEAAALAAGGKKEEAATEAMRDMFNAIQMSGTVVIGEGETALEDLLPHLAKHGTKQLQNVQGIAFRDRDNDGSIVRTEPRPM